MKSFCSFVGSAVLGFSLLGLCQLEVRAALLPPGGGVYPLPGETDPVGGGLITTLGPVPFAAATFTGVLTSSVIGGDTSNPFPGGLTFTYLLTCTGGPDGISELSITSFKGFMTDVSYQVVPGGPPPGLIPTSAGRQPDGSVVDFTYQVPPIGAGTLLPGETSALLVIQTDALTFAPGAASAIDGSAASPIATLVTAIIPEPGAVGLVLAGLGVLVLAFRRID